ncbi:MAG: hypothetical protein HeimC3_52530 [Candidatus Heimdallarchaeota archaeon LC_3]|nr:MAG: hypothetical protein HeimC3_52530 [Candidatus Heimdallarchaeota archaeon LC_3]
MNFLKKDRQHYIQKKVLSHFTNTPNRKYDNQTIWVYDKKDNRIFKRNIKDAAVERKFLDESADDTLTEIEQECYKALSRIIDNHCITCNKFNDQEVMENYNFFYRYLAHQVYRTPSYRRRLKELNYWNKRSETEIQEYQSSLFKKAKYVLYNFDPLNQNSAIPEKRADLSSIYYTSIKILSKIKLNQADDLAASIYNIIQPIVLVNETNIPYITNDAGFSWYFPFKKLTIDLLADGQKIKSWWVFPISPEISIFLCTTKSISTWANSIKDEKRGMILKCKDTKTIELVNKSLYEYAERFLYSSIRHSIFRKM